MSYQTITCLVVVCDGCGAKPSDDDTGGTPHFDNRDQAAEYFGFGPTRVTLSGVAELPDGSHYCWECKNDPHRAIPGDPIPQLCARCGELVEEHADRPDLPAADAVGQLDMLGGGQP